MNRLPGLHARLTVICWMVLLGIGSGQAPDPLGDLQFKYRVAMDEVKSAGHAEMDRLTRGYVSALTRLENESQNVGQLDLLLKARQEREQFQKSGKPGNDPTAELVRLREILEQSGKPVREKMAASASDLSRKYLEQLEGLQVTLTKTGKIEQAIQAKAEAAAIRASLSQPEAKPTENAPQSSPPSSSPAGRTFAAVPTISPAPVAGNPFRDGNWPVAMAIPEGTYRFEGDHSIKGEKGRQILLAPGSTFQGGDNAKWTVGNSLVVAKEVNFRKFVFRGDLGSVLHFEKCRFEDMLVGKGGPWFGGNFMSRWQLKDCTVTGSFIDRWVIKHTGVQINGGLFERVEFPPIEYEADQEPSEIAGHDWAVFSKVRFRKCTLPASVLSLTENCEFDDCRFVDDPIPVVFKQPVARTLYVAGCTNNLKKLSKNLALEMKPLGADRPTQ